MEDKGSNMSQNHKSNDIENDKKKIIPKIAEEEFSHEFGNYHAAKLWELFQAGKRKSKDKSKCKNNKNDR